MGQFTVDNITKMENPFEALGSGDALAEHVTELNQLPEQAMIAVASRMVIHCPSDQFEDFSRHRIKVLENNGSFYPVLSKAINIRQLIISLVDEKNPKPHRGLTSEFNSDLLNEFPQLFDTLVMDQEVNIALRLAESIPDDAGLQSELLRNISNIQAMELARLTGIAFQLHHHVQSTLLGDKPAEFFKNPECTVDICHQFLPLICKLIAGEEEAIAKQLAKASEDDLKIVPRVLEQLKANATDSENPFIKIAETLNTHLESKTQKMRSQQPTQGASAQGLFATSELRNRTSGADEEEEEEEDSDFVKENDSTCGGCTII